MFIELGGARSSYPAHQGSTRIADPAIRISDAKPSRQREIAVIQAETRPEATSSAGLT
jgi:hypothetical protein